MSDTFDQTTFGKTFDLPTVGDTGNNPSQKDDYVPALEFDDGRNSQYLPLIGL